MAELRYNPLLRDWTMVASHRQNRPQMPKDWCPFCPGSGKVPDRYEVYRYDNDFPALSPTPPTPDPVETPLYAVAPAYGKCEVILYSPNHHASLSRLSPAHIRLVVDLWVQRDAALANDPNHKYVFIFENRGPEVGVTMPHPHGQIYAYPYIPLKIATELSACKAHKDDTGHCLLCDILHDELQDGRRIILQSQYFVAYIPFFTDYPYGVFIEPIRHVGLLGSLSDEEKDDLARVLKSVTAGMDALFDREFPYMMALHQRPAHLQEADEYYHFHIEFYPPLREKEKIKYLASSETGAWAPCNPTAVEETSVLLREAVQRAERAWQEEEEQRNGE